MQAASRLSAVFITGMLALSATRLAGAEPAAADAAPAAANDGSASPDCVSAFEQGQEFVRQRKLKAASDLFITCSQPSCPRVVSQECTNLFSDVQKQRPSVALVAKDRDQQLVDARVLMDGQLLAERLDGRAILIDPGPHEFRFEVAGRPAVVVQALVGEGEKNKVLVAEFGTKDKAPAAVSTSASVAPTAPTDFSPRHRVSPAVYVLGGVGVVSLITGTALRLIADSDYRDLERTCKPYCTDDDKDPVKTKYVVSSVAFGVGAAALLGAGAVYLLTGKPQSTETTAVYVVPTSSGALGALSGSF